MLLDKKSSEDRAYAEIMAIDPLPGDPARFRDDGRGPGRAAQNEPYSHKGGAAEACFLGSPGYNVQQECFGPDPV